MRCEPNHETRSPEAHPGVPPTHTEAEARSHLINQSPRKRQDSSGAKARFFQAFSARLKPCPPKELFMRQLLVILEATWLAIFAVACNGGSSSINPPPPPAANERFFV